MRARSAWPRSTALAVMFLLPTLRHSCPLDSQSQTPGKRAEAAGTGRGPGRAPDCLAILVASAEHIRWRNMGSRYAGERAMPYELRPPAWPAGLCCCSVFGSMRSRTLARLWSFANHNPANSKSGLARRNPRRLFWLLTFFFASSASGPHSACSWLNPLSLAVTLPHQFNASYDHRSTRTNNVRRDKVRLRE